ncbi:Golgi apparatus membrane protein TVP38 [Trametes pubescens]|uniref:Golgi apparatus membrane protein TVP38 n=1 Tax=Trametes pubescens TaxID=154538 RepID=A0A1M2VFE0_TRAPU|nr:Golgi apparatus membrane protein TVP38 [Trametes pubescens]
MSSHAYPLVPATAIGFGARGHKDSIPGNAVDVPNLMYVPMMGEGPYEGDKDLASAGVRSVLRTPSPTPSEAQVRASKVKLIGDWRGILDWWRTLSWRRSLDWRRYANPHVHANTTFIVFFVYQINIITWMQPFANWMHERARSHSSPAHGKVLTAFFPECSTPGGWMVPIAIIFVFLFPLLFGYEIVAIVWRDVWGLWIGFGLTAVGTLFGELAHFYVYKSFFYARGRRFEDMQLKWALYAQIVREGGTSAHRGLSTCGTTMWCFLVSTMLSLPKQLAMVYVSAVVNSGGNPTTTLIIKIDVLLATLATPVGAMHYVNKKVDEVKGDVIYARRKARCSAGESRVWERDDLNNDVELELGDRREWKP